MRHIHTKRSGKLLINLFLILLLLGCTAYESYDLYYALPNGYFISRVNSKQIAIAWDQNWKTDLDSNSGVYVIDKYFVKGFSYNDRFIGLFGTHTQLNYATEIELESNELQYYIIDTKEQEIYGPLNSERAFQDALMEIGVENLSDWFITEDYPHKWKNNYRKKSG